MWSGYSLGFGLGKGSGSPLQIKNFMDVLKNSTGSFTEQYYWLFYGNGSDYLKNTKKDISGFNFPPVGPNADVGDEVYSAARKIGAAGKQ